MNINNEKLTQVLEKIGLTENEAKVYYAAISLGPSPILALSRSAGVKRTTVYSVVESLKMKGLMGEEHKGLKTIFVATSPERLEDVLDERKKVLAKHMGDFTTIFNLRAGEGTLRYYESLEAVKGVYDDILKDIRPHDYYLVIGDVERFLELDQKFFGGFLERRSKMDIEMRLLYSDSEKARYFKKFARNFNQQSKILPEGTKLTTSLVITPQKIVINQYETPFSCIVIQTKSAIQMQKEIFEIIWRSIPE